MSRQLFLDLARRKLRMPIGADLVLHEKSDAPAILRDGKRLGAVLAEAATRYDTPLAIPLMDLTLEKGALLAMLGIAAADAATYHFEHDITQDMLERVHSGLSGTLDGNTQVHVDAVRFVAAQKNLVPVGLVIGPFSLMTKMLADPITPVYLAGEGVTAAEDPEVARVERALQMAEWIIHRSITRQLAAGAKVIMVAEPAANVAFISPKQMAAGADVWRRYVIEPNLRLRQLLTAAQVELIFHCCGELCEPMLRGFTQLQPALLSLGSSRRLWEDAAIVPKDIVLYGNLPTKQFYSDRVITLPEVERQTRDLIGRMGETGHPFILGSECDVLTVAGCECVIREKVRAMLNCVM